MSDRDCGGCFFVKLLAVVGAVAVIAGIAFAVYRYFTPDYLEDLEDDFDDYFEDDDEVVEEDDPMADLEKDADE